MTRSFRVGNWDISTDTGTIRSGNQQIQLEPRVMDLLVHLCDQAGEVLSKKQLIKAVWQEAFVSDDVLTSALWKLRQALGDDPKHPNYIQTIPRRGYRLVASVRLPLQTQASPMQQARRIGGPVLSAIILVFAVSWWTLDEKGSEISAGEITSIAVLPLDNLMNDPEQDYFVDGMTDAIITKLSKIRALKVISRTSVMQYKQTKKSIPEIADDLAVDAIVEGSVLRAEEQVRITVQLIQATTDTHVWGESYDRELQEILALQSEVAQTIAREVQVQLTQKDRHLFSVR